MTRSIEQRLRTLEADARIRPVRIVWSNTSDPVEWERQIAEMIARGKASPGDEFMRVGWLRPQMPMGEPAPK
jgi:hypothetical protein